MNWEMTEIEEISNNNLYRAKPTGLAAIHRL